MKQLEIGGNYGEIFGLEAEKGKKLIYRGGDMWQGIDTQKGVDKTIESAGTTAKALEYINRPSVFMGRMG